jgi:hypothetical protein
MTSTHRLIAVVVVWLAFAVAVAVTLSASSLFMPPYAVLLLSVIFVLAALVATHMITLARGSESAERR